MERKKRIEIKVSSIGGGDGKEIYREGKKRTECGCKLQRQRYHGQRNGRRDIRGGRERQTERGTDRDRER